MRRLIANFAAATLLMHALVGCCWHHQHLETATCSDETQILPVVCGGHFHSHADHDHEPGAPADHRHSGDDGCGEESCRFVKVDVPTGPSPLDGPVATVIELLQPLLLSDHRFASRDRLCDHRFAGVPLHLRHQVLVI